MYQGDLFIHDEIEKICASICRHVPLECGSTWVALYNPIWPDEFRHDERNKIRVIAMNALMTARPDLKDAILSYWGRPGDMD